MSTSQRFFRAFRPGVRGTSSFPEGNGRLDQHSPSAATTRFSVVLIVGIPKIHAAAREREPKLLLSTPWGRGGGLYLMGNGNVGTVSILRTGSQAETCLQRTTCGARSETPLPNLNGHPGTEQGGGSQSRRWHQCDQEFQSLCVGPVPALACVRKRVHRASSRRAAARTSLPN